MLLNLSVPVLGWLDALDNGEGRQGARFLDFSSIASIMNQITSIWVFPKIGVPGYPKMDGL